jgi:rhamnogalacturonyl hydrolase YesR
MFMITAIQAQAYTATGNPLYAERAAKEIVKYLNELQQPNGLFYHAPDVPFFWGRGNGWVAAGITELLRVLPANSPYRAPILHAYTRMMQTLKQQQNANGMWHQLVDDPQSWAETSGSAMFTYAMITGVKKGWLDAAEYAPVARKAWLALVTYINSNGDVREVCEGTNKKNDRQYYLDRKRVTGDMHGQAPYLWCAYALME